MIKALLSRFKEPIERALSESISSFGPKTPLRDAIEYSLRNGGRFRPAIVYLIGDALKQNLDDSSPLKEAALAIEFFHTASLIADDLPCMDNDTTRRSHPSLHSAFNETTAILATYALIAAGYDRIRLGVEKLNRVEILPLAIEIASRNTGILGATGGQYSDLFPPALNEGVVLDIIDKKTGTLFEISFLFGWLFGGGSLSSLDLVKSAALAFGRAFQISDDLADIDQGGLNYASIVGKERAKVVINDELQSYYLHLKLLNLDTSALIALGQLIHV